MIFVHALAALLAVFAGSVVPPVLFGAETWAGYHYLLRVAWSLSVSLPSYVIMLWILQTVMAYVNDVRFGRDRDRTGE